MKHWMTFFLALPKNFLVLLKENQFLVKDFTRLMGMKESF